MEELHYTYSTALEQNARQTSNLKILSTAAKLYAIYLKAFKQSKRADEIWFYYGQIQFTQKRHLAATKTLMKMLKDFPKSKLRKDASDVMVTAAQYAVDEDKRQYQIPKAGQAKRPMKIPAVRQLYAKALDQYLVIQPKNENAAAMLYASGTVYFDFGHYAEAQKRYRKYLMVAPTGEFAQTVAIRLLYHARKVGNPEEFSADKARVEKVAQLKNDPKIAPLLVGFEATGDSKDDSIVDDDDDRVNKKKVRKSKKSKRSKKRGRKKSGKSKKSPDEDSSAKNEVQANSNTAEENSDEE